MSAAARAQYRKGINAADARILTCDRLRVAGFAEVTMLNKPAQPSDAVEPGPRVVAPEAGIVSGFSRIALVSGEARLTFAKK